MMKILVKYNITQWLSIGFTSLGLGITSLGILALSRASTGALQTRDDLAFICIIALLITLATLPSAILLMLCKRISINKRLALSAITLSLCAFSFIFLAGITHSLAYFGQWHAPFLSELWAYQSFYTSASTIASAIGFLLEPAMPDLAFVLLGGAVILEIITRINTRQNLAGFRDLC